MLDHELPGLMIHFEYGVVECKLISEFVRREVIFIGMILENLFRFQGPELDQASLLVLRGEERVTDHEALLGTLRRVRLSPLVDQNWGRFKLDTLKVHLVSPLLRLCGRVLRGREVD